MKYSQVNCVASHRRFANRQKENIETNNEISAGIFSHPATNNIHAIIATMHRLLKNFESAPIFSSSEAATELFILTKDPAQENVLVISESSPNMAFIRFSDLVSSFSSPSCRLTPAYHRSYNESRIEPV